MILKAEVHKNGKFLSGRGLASGERRAAVCSPDIQAVIDSRQIP